MTTVYKGYFKLEKVTKRFLRSANSLSEKNFNHVFPVEKANVKVGPSFRSRLFIHVILCVIFVITAYIEIITYSILPFQWIKPPDCKPPKCTKLLLVADPQIIGSEFQGNDFLNSIAKWDSDRYIRRTFIQAFNYLKPDVVIFLGDLMDVGHISSDEEFSNDVYRFLDIFQLSSLVKNVPKVFLPGDNDIGGIDDIMLPQVVHRFNRIFNQSEGPLLFDQIEFYKVNIMTYEMQEPIYNDMGDTDYNIRVALSHVPLLPNPTHFVQRVVKRVRPQVIFSGHAHFSTHFVASESDIWKSKYVHIFPNETEGKTFKVKTGLIHEIIVPTCSYRMGVKNMGYGAAFIDTENKMLHYNVLWLPRRFLQLFIYVTVIFTSFPLFFLSVFSRVVKKLFRFIFWNYSKRMVSRNFP